MMVCCMTWSKFKVKVKVMEVQNVWKWPISEYFLRQYGCNQKTDSEVWYQVNIRFFRGQILIIFLIRCHVTFKVRVLREVDWQSRMGLILYCFFIGHRSVLPWLYGTVCVCVCVCMLLDYCNSVSAAAAVQNADVRQMYMNAQTEWLNHLKVCYFSHLKLC